MTNKRFAVIGGTDYDTNLGYILLKELGFNAVKKSIKNTAIEQHYFQLNHNVNDYIINEIKILKQQHHITHVLIYCVSVSGLINHFEIENQTEVILITPHSSISNKLKNVESLGILSANNLSANNFEKHILNINKNCIVLKKAEINIVNDIEQNINPSEIIKKYQIDRFINNLIKNKTKNLLLGCTHFSYLFDKLSENNEIKILDVKLFIAQELNSTILYYDSV